MVIMYNHSTFVLGYLLLLGYDVTGAEYIKRVEGLGSRNGSLYDYLL